MQIDIQIFPSSIKDIVVLYSSERYITFVALENCIDYFSIVNCIGKNKIPQIELGSELKVFRSFLNSVESISNIVDYLYYEKKEHSNKQTFETFKRNLLNKHQILCKVNDISNAYKHCKRYKNGQENVMKTWAKDIKFDHEVLSSAFKFWVDYINKKIQL